MRDNHSLQTGDSSASFAPLLTQNRPQSSAAAELARRELARRHYSEYLAYSYGDSWVRTRLSSFLANRIQSFIETDTGHAYDILIIECPPQHGKSMTVSESLPFALLSLDFI